MGSGGMSSDNRQHYIPTGLNGNWQSDKDMPHRREMIQHMYVVCLLVCYVEWMYFSLSFSLFRSCVQCKNAKEG